MAGRSVQSSATLKAITIYSNFKRGACKLPFLKPRDTLTRVKDGLVVSILSLIMNLPLAKQPPDW